MTRSSASAAASVSGVSSAVAAASPTVSTQWVCDHLGSDTMVVLDATVLRQSTGWISGIDDHLRSRIPAAVFADLLVDFSDPAGAHPFTRPSAERFEQATRRLGITAETVVVVYDGAFGQWAARMWWLFRSFGFDRVSVLDGGFTKWNLEDRPVETSGSGTGAGSDSVARRAAGADSQPFRAEERSEFWADKSFVQSVVDGRTDALLLSAVPSEFFAPGFGSRAPDPQHGQHQPGHSFSPLLDSDLLESLQAEYGQAASVGHIPGSVNVPSASLVNAETHALLRRDELRRAFGPVLTAGSVAAGEGDGGADAGKTVSGAVTAAAVTAGAMSAGAMSAASGSPHIVAYCGDGISAATDALALAVLGHTAVSIYDGSLSEWVADPTCPVVGGVAA